MIIIIIIAVICLLIAHFMQEQEKLRREKAHERRMERFERLIGILRKPASDKSVDSIDINEPDHNSKS